MADRIAPAKPRFGEPCNGCGVCCIMEVCDIGKVAFPDAAAPCPGLRWVDGKHRCGIVLAERMMDEQYTPIADALGINTSCDSDG